MNWGITGIAARLLRLKVSDYAETNAEECLAEIIKGLLSGDKYSDDIIEFGNKITNGKLSSLFG